MSHRRAVMLLLSDTKTTHFVFELLTVPRPISAQVLVHIMFHVHVIMLCFNVSLCDATIAPKKGERKNFATLRKLLRLCTLLSPFFSSFDRSGVVEVTRNLNDIFLEVMFSIAKQKKLLGNCENVEIETRSL
jgi:hypothetical protein